METQREPITPLFKANAAKLMKAQKESSFKNTVSLIYRCNPSVLFFVRSRTKNAILTGPSATHKIAQWNNK